MRTIGYSCLVLALLLGIQIIAFQEEGRGGSPGSGYATMFFGAIALGFVLFGLLFVVLGRKKKENVKESQCDELGDHPDKES